jgi:hypothetical protein
MSLMHFKHGGLMGEAVGSTSAALPSWSYFNASAVGGLTPDAVWAFDGSANQLNDLSSNGYNLTIQAGTAGQAEVGTQSGGFIGLACRGTTSFATSNAQALRSIGAVTIEVLFMPTHTGITGGGTRTIITHGNDGETEADNVTYMLRHSNTQPSCRVEWEHGAGVDVETGYNSTKIIPGNIQYLAYVRESDGVTGQTIINGRSVQTEVASDAPSGGTDGQIWVCSREDDTDRYYGIIFSIRIFLAAMTQAQWEESYNAVRGWA